MCHHIFPKYSTFPGIIKYKIFTDVHCKTAIRNSQMLYPSDVPAACHPRVNYWSKQNNNPNDYIHDVQLPTFHVIRQTFLTSYSSLYTSQPHQAHTCYTHAQTHTKDCIILAQCWIISFLKDYYGIYLVKWINTEVFFNCNVNIFTVSNTILYSLRIELETYFFFLIYHI